MGQAELQADEFGWFATNGMHKLGLSDAERRDVARLLVRKGVPMPEQATWPGSTEPHWQDFVGELVGYMLSRFAGHCSAEMPMSCDNGPLKSPKKGDAGLAPMARSSLPRKGGCRTLKVLSIGQ
jgi:hypothetical protein